MYKVVRNNKVVDVIENPHFITFLPTNHIAFTNKANAEGFIGSDGDTIYSFLPNKRPDVYTASLKHISAEEFNRLQSLLNSNQDISADDVRLNETKQAVIQRLSNICKAKIISGFSIKLSDGEYHAFKLTTEDQLNLMMIENQLAMGVQSFVYHATNQPCRVFIKEDMIRIIEAFKKHTLYHTTYFNAAKQYIKSLVSIEEVNLFTYGMDISDSVEDAILRQILKSGGIKE